jgi:hypothetical protein
MISYRPSSLPYFGFHLFTRLYSVRHNSCVSGIGETQFGTSDLIASTYHLTYKNRKRFPGAASVSQQLLRCVECKHLLP